jgi:diguanylate cyclase (GGDEF)-like protein
VVGFKSIKSKILAFAVLATLVPSVGLGLLTYWRYQALVSGNVAVELRVLSNYVRSELALWLTDRVDDVRALSNASTIREGLAAAAKGPRAPQPIEAYLRSVQEKLDSNLELTVLDADGRLVASTAASPAPITLPATWSERTALGGVIADGPRWDSARATTTLTVVVPVLSVGNDVLGALSAVLDLGRLQPRLERIAQGSAIEAVLLAQDGAPVLGTRGGTAGLSPILPQVLQRLRTHPGESVAYVGHRRREVIGLAGAVGSSPIAIVVERERADVYRARRRLLEQFAGLTVALALLIGVLAFRLGRSIVTPLHTLVSAVDRVAGGDLSVNLQNDGKNEIKRLTRAFNKMVRRLRRSHDKVEAARATLQRQNRLLHALSVTDALTGLNNRKKLDSTLAEQLALFRRHHRPFAVLMLDLDQFKLLNDTHGHLVGDRMLVNVAGILRRCVRKVDHVARYGGEEFAIILVEVTLEGALETAERIRSSVEASAIVADGRSVRVTVSLGVTRSRESDARPEDVLDRADIALYKAKHAGRNRVCCADDGPATGARETMKSF